MLNFLHFTYDINDINNKTEINEKTSAVNKDGGCFF